MKTNWIELGLKVGSLSHDETTERGGDSYAKAALEEILGDEWIYDTCEKAMSTKRGCEIAMNCLRYLKLEKSVDYAYNTYKENDSERSISAVWLLKQLAHPKSFDWIEEFIKDEKVVHWGLGLLDQLLWQNIISYDDERMKIEAIFKKCQSLYPKTSDTIKRIKENIK